MKMALLAQQIEKLPLGTVTTRKQVPKIREFVTFVAVIYFKCWVTCSRATDSPLNDLTLYKDILWYAKINEPISDSAREAFK